MEERAYVVFWEDDTVTVGRVDTQGFACLEVKDTSDETEEDRPEQILSALGELGRRSEGVVVALGSEHCFAVTISIEDLPDRGRREAMLYRLEEKLPISIEELAVEFLPHDDKALGVAVESAELRTLVSDLEEKGVVVEAITPTVLLALSALEDLKDADHTIVWGSTVRLDVIVRKAGQVVNWRSVANRLSDLKRALGVGDAESPVALSLLKVSKALRRVATTKWSGFELLPESEQKIDRHEAAAQSALAITSGKLRPIVNFRTDRAAFGEPHRRLEAPIKALRTALLLALLLTALGFFLRAVRYDKVAAEREAQIVQVFHQTYPDHSPPPSVLLRLESRLRELRGLTGADGQAVARGASSPSAVRLLYEFLRRLPKSMRFGILELRAADDGVLARGHTRSHGDADQIAASVRAGGELVVEAPRTEQLRTAGVSFLLRASRPETNQTENR